MLVRTYKCVRRSFWEEAGTTRQGVCTEDKLGTFLADLKCLWSSETHSLEKEALGFQHGVIEVRPGSYGGC